MENQLLQVEQLIPDMESLGQPETNHSTYLTLSRHPACTGLTELDALFPGHSKKVLRVDNRLNIDYPHMEIVLVDSEQEKILNYTTCIINDAIRINDKPTLHTAVWRPLFDVNEEAIHRLSKSTFSGYLLGEYNIMATLGNLQTHGFTFWLSRVCASRAEHIRVFGYKVSTGELRPITRSDQRSTEKIWLWNVDNTQYRLLITAR
ncbi:hypothetical protein FJU30_25610 [Affinibrenneria salicis]|uniref:Uncharacterized protein n=1 Tax=Affinibrenneria salicis TaxID=2590031 RepID=A0A5J5FQP5_9GAMM|nr:hypothetical protein [Affinibrenneria salicis]KAA8994926.1 hypothetical protein FJU30_25610 [Affinibrenneria salicis]